MSLAHFKYNKYQYRHTDGHTLRCGDKKFIYVHSVTPGTNRNQNNEMLYSNPYPNFHSSLIITLFQTLIPEQPTF